MKKILLSMTAVCTLLCFSACSNKDVATPLKLNTTTTATIKGYVTYQPDNTVVDRAKPSASNVSITATVANSSLSSYATNGKLTLRTSYDASSGMYTIEVPAPSNGAAIAVTTSVSSFSGPQLQAGTTPATKNRVFGYYTPTPATFNTTVSAGQTVLGTRIDYTFAAAPIQ